MADIPVDREFWGRLLQQVARRTRRRADAEDLLHTAYLRFAEYQKLNPVENASSFLVRTAVNVGIDNYRRSRTFAKILPQDVAEIEHFPLQDEVMAARARLERVKVGLSKLPPRTREVFLMHRLENLKYREIADQLGVSQSAVEKHIAKAVLFLTEWVKDW